MSKVKKLRLLIEAKELVTLVLDKGKYNFVSEDGISDKMSEDEIKKILNSIGLDVDKIMRSVKKDSLADLEIDSKNIKKLGLD